ncbi:hypothetical protein A2J03_19395 [Rhodococcus sp. EPR-157]|uniref:hypothetical protein n=1 Tax=Rhodococcus sp. EPR-157 TaxID=1813677 RepID=UPI0007BB4EC9|nr:hypothetical protein [Rhodococcus sp. EPR-157]KZF11550.1 hypothetical protein A2J03_19395 [Rhodococcus sp. EPR-157]
MTLADTRPEVTTPASSNSADLSTSQLEMMRAFFCYEFEVELLDRESVPAVTPEAVEEWIEALEHSGLFVAAELQTMARAWRAEPEALVALLIGDVDEVAAKREVVEFEVLGAAVKASYLRAS